LGEIDKVKKSLDHEKKSKEEAQRSNDVLTKELYIFKDQNQ
jgi:hypothetical protein